MKKIKKSIVFLLLFHGTSIIAQESRISIPLSKPGHLYELNIRAAMGQISISGYAGKEVVIETIGLGSSKTSENRTGIPGVQVREENNVITLTALTPGKMRGMNIKIPFKLTRLKLDAQNCHPINIKDVSGELEISNGSGRMFLTDISGSIVASAVNGTITAAFKSVNPKAAMAFSVLEGNIDLTLPPSTSAVLKLKSGYGLVLTGFNLKSSIKPLSQLQEGGLFQFKSKEWINGTINNGGPEYLIKTVNGRIIVKKSIR